MKQHIYASERNCTVKEGYGLSYMSWTGLDAEAVKVRFLEEHVRNGSTGLPGDLHERDLGRRVTVLS